jgi:hypothetical protein
LFPIDALSTEVKRKAKEGERAVRFSLITFGCGGLDGYTEVFSNKNRHENHACLV